MSINASVAIKVENLSKEYLIGQRHRFDETFREMLASSLAASFQRFAKKKSTVNREESFWALKDVSFEICKGEVVGIIGRNGAGKSTLLKILSRITAPTRGRAEIRGRVASLLDVGTGFHPELTGRENIYLNGAILGMTRAEINRKFDDIAEFAEIDGFLETPVKRYSSGMYVRLAFAVAAHLEPEILVVDEVLAVGDIHFQRKCLGKMQDVAGLGRTVLFVSHNMSAVEQLCSKGIVLNQGRVSFIGKTVEAIAEFLSDCSETATAASLHGPLQDRLSVPSIVINGVGANQSVRLSPSSEVTIDIETQVEVEIPSARVICSIRKADQKVVDLYDAAGPAQLPQGFAHIRAKLPAFFLSPGEYSLGIVCVSRDNGLWIWVESAAYFSILPESCDLYDIGNLGLVHLTNRCSRLTVGSQSSLLS